MSRRIRRAVRRLRDRTIDSWTGREAAERAEEEAKRRAAEEEARRKAEEEQRRREQEYRDQITKDQSGLESETASNTGDWSETGLGGVSVDTSDSTVAPGVVNEEDDRMKRALRRFGKSRR